jgi:HD-GYP domain-containing protein (c-di-GMP phosphodiesterase class II)
MLTILVIVLRIVELRAARDELAQANKREKELIIREQKSMQRLFKQTAAALVNAIDAKDTYTHGHSARVADYSRQLAKMNGKSRQECDTIYYTALVHDVGKIGVPGSIINKDSRLTDEEYAIIKAHPTTGAQILDSISEFPELSIGAHYHHERYDGKGYPEGLKGEEIPYVARIICCADCFDAMASKRVYKKAFTLETIMNEFKRCAGTQFDPDIAKVVVEMMASGKLKPYAADNTYLGDDDKTHRITKKAEDVKPPTIGIARHDNALFFSVYNANTTT